MDVNIKSLIGKLNPTCRSALEGAAGLCFIRTHDYVDVEHLLVKLCEDSDSDFQRICNHYEIVEARLSKDLSRALERSKTGNTRDPTFSRRIVRLISVAWNIASIDFGAGSIRSGHLVLALLGHEDLARFIRDSTSEFEKIS